MADIELVIKIPEEMWERIKDGYVPLGISKYLKNGTPLPKGHGRLIDANEIDNNIYDLTRSMDLNYGQISEVIDTAPTFIEADKAESEDK